MLSTYAMLLKKDVWKLLAFVIVLTLLMQFPWFSTWLLKTLSISGKPAAALILVSLFFAEMVSLSALALLPYWACGKKIRDNKKPFVIWTVLMFFYVLGSIWLSWLSTFLLLSGEMSMAEIAQYVSVCFMIWTVVRYGLLVVFLAVIFAVFEKTSILGGLWEIQRHWKGTLLTFICFAVAVLAAGGIAKLLHNPLFPIFVVLWMLVTYGFAAVHQLENS